MNTQQNLGPQEETADISAELVADYLESHTDFFTDNLTLLGKLQIPHLNGGAISLIERQVTLLREQNEQYKCKLVDLVQNGHDNDALNRHMHNLALEMIRTPSLSKLVDTIHQHLQSNLDADASVMRLHGLDKNISGARIIDPGEPALTHFEHFFRNARPFTGYPKPEQIDYLFCDDATTIASAALIPLGKKSAQGILAIGSHNAHRFHPGMETLFLQQLGELAGLLIQQHIAAGT